MFLACKICWEPWREGEDWFSNMVCSKCAHIAERYQRLEDDLHEANSKIDRIQEAVLFILSDVHKELLEQPTVEIDSQRVRDLWDAAELKRRDATTIKHFVAKEIAYGMVLSQAFSLFRKRNGLGETKFKAKLQHLYEACLHAIEFHGWENTFTLTPDDLPG